MISWLMLPVVVLRSRWTRSPLLTRLYLTVVEEGLEVVLWTVSADRFGDPHS
jgi:hypothetical protein